MGQEFTITFEGEGNQEFIPPDALMDKLRYFLAILRHVDANSWNVGQPRLKWGIIEARTESPLRVKVGSRVIAPDYRAEPLTLSRAVDGLLQLEQGAARAPQHFDDETLRYARQLAEPIDGLKRFVISGSGVKEYSPSQRLAENAERLRKPPKPKDIVSEGSIQGVLRRVTVDEREEHETSDLQVIDRLTGELVACNVTPDMAKDVGAYVGHRVVLFGSVRRDRRTRKPKRIEVRRFRGVKREPPSLHDLHRLGISISRDEDSGEYADDTR